MAPIFDPLVATGTTSLLQARSTPMAPTSSQPPRHAWRPAAKGEPGESTPDALFADQLRTALSRPLPPPPPPRRGVTPMAPTSPTTQANGSNAEPAPPLRHVPADASRLSPALLPFAPLLRSLAPQPGLSALGESGVSAVGEDSHRADNPQVLSGGTAVLAPRSLGAPFSLF